MKPTLLIYVFLAFGLFINPQKGYAQLNYSEDFESDDIAWTNPDFAYWLDDYESCDGYSIVTELYSFYDPGTTVSGLLGMSNGQLATLTYDYKLVDYYDETEAYPNSPNWGSFTIEYAASQSGPWTLLETVSPANHIVSADCATRTVTFTPPGGSNVYIRLTSGANQNEDIDAYLYFDNVSVTQAASLPCDGTPPTSVTAASTLYACNETDVTLSLSPPYFVAGLTYQWQSSTDNVTYTNIATGGTAATYTTTQAVSTWYRAKITCTASTLTATSTPIQVQNSGLDCLCQVEFDSGVEPITFVEFAGISNTSSADVSSPQQEDFTSIAPGQVDIGETYDITIKGNTVDVFGDGYENYITVFIDWNHNGDLTDDGESYEIGVITNSDGEDDVELTGEIEVPDDALPGLTYMRVFKLFDEYTGDPCSSDEGYGQVEDYLLNVNCNLEAPEFDEVLEFCTGATGIDLPSDDVAWYGSATGDDIIAEDTPLASGTYYAAQVEGLCESEERTPVEVSIIALANIEGEAIQDLGDASGTTENLVIIVQEGATVTWYATLADAQANTNPIADTLILEDGATYYAVATLGNCSTDVFAVTISNTGSVTGFANGTFSYYPNPVKDVLNLEYIKNIDSATVYNLVGQQVLVTTINQSKAQLDLSNLAAGTYMVKVSANNATATIKVVKQ
ncbi:T9SS type A sorting domain-containing protein [Flavobacterium subsaxonicum]|uniref:Uncharacterized protein n=1 Tax=Flavobacterium subsaxonicum WB 4.1-42 = DSM 21790 TaxID=1121898 RepID=A0A0A2MMN7_9FLAO|nr:T9SS type A sorting domain-containing protein [Flavobacterium subsaxonicum]KGO92836.1 hypothetical protein Q766_09365 [Flavobacterium subsaxonicum WB 4.1-42 = DSM 21790]